MLSRTKIRSGMPSLQGSETPAKRRYFRWFVTFDLNHREPAAVNRPGAHAPDARRHFRYGGEGEFESFSCKFLSKSVNVRPTL